MSSINSEFIERYQLTLEKDPGSRVFAPLAEAYRKMGLIDQAIEICRQGLEHHPDFASGRVALARALMEKGSETEAIEHLKEATKLSPENLLAHKLLAQLLIKIRQPAEALKSFKMALFLNPEDLDLQRSVQKWEFLMAIEFEDDLFELVDQAGSGLFAMGPWDSKRVEKVTSLADAFTVREEVDRAIALLQFASKQVKNPSISKRLKILQEKSLREKNMGTKKSRIKAALQRSESEDSKSPENTSRKKQKLEKLLRKIKSHAELS